MGEMQTDGAIEAAVGMQKERMPDDYFETMTPEEEQVLIETLERIQNLRKEGLVPNNPRNPFGDNLESAKLMFFGDIHGGGADPENDVITMNQPFSTMVTRGPQAAKAAIKGKLRGEEDIPLDRLWNDIEVPNINHQAVISLAKSMRAEIKDSENTTFIMFGTGDYGTTANTAADHALSADVYMDIRNELENAAKSKGDEKAKVFLALAEGNHDSDINNHPMSGWFQKELWGQRIFSQEVGDQVVLSLNTNYYSEFWDNQVERWQQTFEKLPEDDEKRIAFEDFLEFTEEQKQLQEELIQEARESGKAVTIVAHQVDLLTKNVDLENVNVTHIVCGHMHKPENKTIKASGKEIQMVRVGAPFKTIGPVEVPGFSGKKNPVGFVLSMEGTTTEVEELATPPEANLEEIESLL